ncbi:MAG: capsid protein [Reyranellaceae bacterium]
MSTAPFPVDPVLTGIAIQYRNKALIADQVLPRITPELPRKTFKYNVWTKAEQFTVPKTEVGRRGRPSEIEFTASEQTGAVVDYALDDPIPYDDLQNAPEGHDPEAFAVQSIAGLIALDREIRVAALIFASGSYPAANATSLSGNDQWNAYDQAASDPIDDINIGLDTPLIRPNTMVIGRAAFTKLASHPKIIKAVQGNSGDAGIASRQQIAQLFELDQVLVGEGYKNSAKRGQTASYARIWGKACALLYLDTLAAGDGRLPSFGGTFQYGTRIAGATDDMNISSRGGRRVRVVESVKEVITASDLGYFIDTVVA